RAQLGEGRERGVLLREQRVADGPGDADARIVPAEADLVGAVVEVGALVDDLGRLAQHAEAVGETGRDEHLAEVVAGELRAGPLAEGGRARADVDRDVENLALQRADQLALRLSDLRVQAP